MLRSSKQPANSGASSSRSSAKTHTKTHTNLQQPVESFALPGSDDDDDDPLINSGASSSRSSANLPAKPLDEATRLMLKTLLEEHNKSTQEILDQQQKHTNNIFLQLSNKTIQIQQSVDELTSGGEPGGRQLMSLGGGARGTHNKNACKELELPAQVDLEDSKYELTQEFSRGFLSNMHADGTRKHLIDAILKLAKERFYEAETTSMTSCGTEVIVVILEYMDQHQKFNEKASRVSTLSFDDSDSEDSDDEAGDAAGGRAADERTQAPPSPYSSLEQIGKTRLVELLKQDNSIYKYAEQLCKEARKKLTASVADLCMTYVLGGKELDSKAIDALLAQCPTQPSKFNEFKHIMHQCPMYFNESGIFLGDVGGSEHGCSKLIDKVVRLLGKSSSTLLLTSLIIVIAREMSKYGKPKSGHAKAHAPDQDKFGEFPRHDQWKGEAKLVGELLLYKSFAPTSDPVVGAAQKAAKNERVEKKRKRKEDKSKRKRAAS